MRLTPQYLLARPRRPTERHVSISASLKRYPLSYLGEIGLDPVPVGLLLGQSGPILRLSFLLPEDKDDSSGSDDLLGFLYARVSMHPLKNTTKP